MKKGLNILFTTSLFFLVNFAFAFTNGSKNNDQEQDQDGRRKQSQESVRPDDYIPSEVPGGTISPDLRDEEDLESSKKETKTVEPIEADSLEDESVSKYNFIFYFLYKFKYEQEDSI